MVWHRVSEIHRLDSPTMFFKFMDDNPTEVLVVDGIVRAEGGGEVTTGGVNKHVYLLSPVLFKDVVNGIAVEVGTAAEAFSSKWNAVLDMA